MTLKDWHLLPLQSVCAVNPKLGDDVPQPDTLVSFVPMAAVAEQGGGIIQAETRPYSEVAKGYTYFREKDVLFAKITPCMENGKITIARGLANGIGFGSTEFHVIRCGPDVIPEWVFAFVSQPAFRTAAKESFTGTAGQQRVPADFVKNSAIPLPPLPEQHRLVRLLDEADALRRLRARADERMADFIPALFHEMFGDPGYPASLLSDVAEVVSGVAKGRRFNGQPTLTVPYLRVANVQAGYLDLTEIKTIEALPEEVIELSLKKGDVLLTEGGDFDKLGRGAMLEEDLPNCIHQNHVFRVRVNQSQLLPVFFANYLQTQAAKAYFLSCAKKTTNLASINMTQLRGLPVPLPPPSLQHEFSARVAEARALEEKQAQSKARLEALFESMLARAFGGEL